MGSRNHRFDDRQPRRYRPVARLQKLAMVEGMRKSAQDPQAHNRAEIRDLVPEAMVGAPASRDDMGRVVNALFERQSDLPALLNELWKGAQP